MTIKEMTKFLTFCKKVGLKSIKTSDFEAEFNEIALDESAAQKTKTEIKGEEPKAEPMPTEDDLLYWSTGYDPRENKEEQVSA